MVQFRVDNLLAWGCLKLGSISEVSAKVTQGRKSDFKSPL